MKKILSLVLAMMMVLSMANVAFAAPVDVTDAKQQKAVDALMSLGIVKGYEDGSYKPEKVVTRAELAKMLVEALGQGDLVAGSESSFKDSKGTWYDGYVALASGLELVTGYPDGTFKGENPVSYQEAVVMVLRALGYTNQTVNGGVDAYNPTKYKTLAQTLGVLNNVTFKNGGANRGDIASMVYNSIEIDRVEKSEKGLAQKIVIDKEMRPVAGTGTSGDPYLYKEFPVYETLLDKLADRTDITISPASLDSTNKAYRGNMVDLEPYMYQKITAYLNASGHVMFVKSIKTTTVKGTVTGMRTTDVQWPANQDKVRVTKEDKTVVASDWNATATINVYYNGVESTGHTKAHFQRGGIFNGQSVTLVLDADGKVTAAIATKANDSIQVSAPYKAGALKIGSINLPRTAANKVDLTKVTVKGEVTDIEDIVKGDIVTVYYAAGNTSSPAKLVLDVCRDMVEGKITKVDADGYLVIDGELYGEYYHSVDGYRIGLDLGAEGKFFLNSDGDIVAFSGKSVSNVEYALVTSVKDGTRVITTASPATYTLIKDASIKLLDKEGKATTYGFTADAEFKLDTATPESVFVSTTNGLQEVRPAVLGFRNNTKIVTSFDVNADGKITYIAVKTLTVSDLHNINPTSKTFAVADGVVIFNSYDKDNLTTQVGNEATYQADTFAVATVNDLIKTSKTYYALTNAKSEFTLIIADNQLIDDSQYALIVSKEKEIVSGKTIERIAAYIKGERVEYLTADKKSVHDDLIVSEVSSGGAISLVRLPLLNGVISTNVTTDPIAGTSGFVAIPDETITVAVDDTLASNHRLNSKGAAIYVYNQLTTKDTFTFTRVGDDDDLSQDNATFELYDLDNDMDNGYEVVVIRIHR